MLRTSGFISLGTESRAHAQRSIVDSAKQIHLRRSTLHPAIVCFVLAMRHASL